MIVFAIEAEQEVDGPWLAEVVELPGVMAYGESRCDAVARAKVLALRVLADRLEHNELQGDVLNIAFNAT